MSDELRGLEVNRLAVERYGTDTVSPAFSIWAYGDTEAIYTALESIFPRDAIGIEHHGGGFVAGGRQHGEGNVHLVVDTSHPDIPNNPMELLNLVKERLEEKGAEVAVHPDAVGIAARSEGVDAPSGPSPTPNCGTFAGHPKPCL